MKKVSKEEKAARVKLAYELRDKQRANDDAERKVLVQELQDGLEVLKLECGLLRYKIDTIGGELATYERELLAIVSDGLLAGDPKIEHLVLLTFKSYVKLREADTGGLSKAFGALAPLLHSESEVGQVVLINRLSYVVTRLKELKHV